MYLTRLPVTFLACNLPTTPALPDYGSCLTPGSVSARLCYRPGLDFRLLSGLTLILEPLTGVPSSLLTYLIPVPASAIPPPLPAAWCFSWASVHLPAIASGPLPSFTIRHLCPSGLLTLCLFYQEVLSRRLTRGRSLHVELHNQVRDSTGQP